MITAAKCSAGMAGTYYSKDDYYSREKTGAWHGKNAKKLGDFKIEKFNEIINYTERFRTYDIVFQLSKDLTETYLSNKDFKLAIDKVVQDIVDKLNSDEAIKVKFVRTKKKDRFKMKLERDGKTDNLKIILSSHKVAVTNCIETLKKLSELNISEKFKSQLGKKFNELGIEYDSEKYDAFVFERSGTIGDDFTFSVPKSVSLEMYQNELSFRDIMESQNKAVSETLDYIESNYVYARIFQDKKLEIEKTSNLLSARFDHFTSREKDPHLHTHCILFNQTWCSDGKLRALDNRHLYQNKYLFDRLYVSILSRELQKKGFEIEYTDKERGNFEINGYKRETIQHYSTRNRVITDWSRVKKVDITDFHNRERAFLSTRPKKEIIDFENWKYGIQEELKLLKVYAAREKKFCKFIELNPQQKEARFIEAKEIIEEKNAAFTKENFLSEALVRGEGKISIEDAEKFFNLSGHFREAGEEKQLGLVKKFYTTEKNIQIEKSIFLKVQEGKGKWNGLTEKEAISRLADTPLNMDQVFAASFMLTSKDRIVAIQGDAGVGKTFTLNNVRAIFEEMGHKVFMIAPSNKAVEALREEADAREASTIHNFLNRMEKIAGNETQVPEGQIQNRWNFDGLVPGDENEVIILDEASMVDNRLMSYVMQVSERRNGKLILIGDTKQLLPVSQGKSFCNLVNEKQIDFVRMSKALRQSLAPPDISRSVSLAAMGNIEASIEKLDAYTYEIFDRSLRLNQIAKDFASLSQQDRIDSFVITALHSDRHELNQAIRSRLKQSGELSPGRNIIVTNGRGKEEMKEFSPGDRIVFFKTDSLFGQKVLKGDIGVISKMNGRQIFCDIGDKKISFSTRNYNHFDYAYSITVYRSQGASIKNVFLNIDTNQHSMNHRNGYYVMISRTKEKLRLYTNDKDELFDAVNKYQKKLSIWDFKGDRLLSFFRPKDFQSFSKGVQKKLLRAEFCLKKAYSQLYEAEIKREMALKVLNEGRPARHNSLLKASLKCDGKVENYINKAEKLIGKVPVKNKPYATGYLGTTIEELKSISGSLTRGLESMLNDLNKTKLQIQKGNFGITLK